MGGSCFGGVCIRTISLLVTVVDGLLCRLYKNVHTLEAENVGDMENGGLSASTPAPTSVKLHGVHVANEAFRHSRGGGEVGNTNRTILSEVELLEPGEGEGVVLFRSSGTVRGII